MTDLKKRARELLAAEYERDGAIHTANDIRADNLAHDWSNYAIRAIVAALQQAHPAGDAVRELPAKGRDQARFLREHKGHSESAVSAADAVDCCADELDSAFADDRRQLPPCLECGAGTAKEAETKCICAGDKDDCHGCELWPDDAALAAPVQPVVDEAMVERALSARLSNGGQVRQYVSVYEQSVMRAALTAALTALPGEVKS